MFHAPGKKKKNLLGFFFVIQNMDPNLQEKRPFLQHRLNNGNLAEKFGSKRKGKKKTFLKEVPSVRTLTPLVPNLRDPHGLLEDKSGETHKQTKKQKKNIIT